MYWPWQFGPAGRTAGGRMVPWTLVAVVGSKTPANHSRYRSLLPGMLKVARLDAGMLGLPVCTRPGFTPIQSPLFQVKMVATCQPPITVSRGFETFAKKCSPLPKGRLKMPSRVKVEGGTVVLL